MVEELLTTLCCSVICYLRNKRIVDGFLRFYPLLYISQSEGRLRVQLRLFFQLITGLSKGPQWISIICIEYKSTVCLHESHHLKIQVLDPILVENFLRRLTVVRIGSMWSNYEMNLDHTIAHWRLVLFILIQLRKLQI